MIFSIPTAFSILIEISIFVVLPTHSSHSPLALEPTDADGSTVVLTSKLSQQGWQSRVGVPHPRPVFLSFRFSAVVFGRSITYVVPYDSSSHRPSYFVTQKCILPTWYLVYISRQSTHRHTHQPSVHFWLARGPLLLVRREDLPPPPPSIVFLVGENPTCSVPAL